MAMTAPFLCERLSHRGHVNHKGILPETPIFQSYLIHLTYIVRMLKHSFINVIRLSSSIYDGSLPAEIDVAVVELIEILKS